MKFLDSGLELYQNKLNALDKKFLLSGEYKGSGCKLKSKCLICEYEWESLPSNLIKNGCPRCANTLPLTLEIVQSRLDARERDITVSGEYKNNLLNIDCQCNVCGGKWRCSTGNLLAGRSCMDCHPAIGGGFDYSKPGSLYYLRISDKGQVYWKIGITNRSIKERFKGDLSKITILYFHTFELGSEAAMCEKNILSMFKDYRVINSAPLKSGNTELFSKDVLQMDHLFWRTI